MVRGHPCPPWCRRRAGFPGPSVPTTLSPICRSELLVPVGILRDHLRRRCPLEHGLLTPKPVMPRDATVPATRSWLRPGPRASRPPGDAGAARASGRHDGLNRGTGPAHTWITMAPALPQGLALGLLAVPPCESFRGPRGELAETHDPCLPWCPRDRTDVSPDHPWTRRSGIPDAKLGRAGMPADQTSRRPGVTSPPAGDRRRAGPG